MSSTDTLPNPEEYEGTYFGIHIHDPEDHEYPSRKFGMIVFVGVFCAFILFSACIVFTIMMINRMHSRRAENQKEAVKEGQHEDLKSNLDLKPYGEEDTTEFMSSSYSSHYSFRRGETSSLSGLEEEDSESEYDDPLAAPAHASADIEMPARVSMNGPPKDKDGACCPICTKVYQYGEPVYTSNNCGHQCHQVCMDKWLKFQNTCPVCNQPFMVHNNNSGCARVVDM